MADQEIEARLKSLTEQSMRSFWDIYDPSDHVKTLILLQTFYSFRLLIKQTRPKDHKLAIERLIHLLFLARR
jgi:hypothetical protein